MSDRPRRRDRVVFSVTEDEGALRDVERQMAADRQSELVRKLTPYFIAFGVAATLGVGGWQVWTAQQTKKAEAASAEYRTILEKTQGDDVVAALAKFEQSAPEGYKTLASLRRAAALAPTDRAAGLALYRMISTDKAAAKRLRDVAALRAAYLSFPDGRESVLKDLGTLVDEASALGALAREVSALAAFEAGDYEAAKQTLEKLAVDPDASEGVKLRADALAPLAAAARSGVNVKGEARASDLAKALGLGVEPAEAAKPMGQTLPKLDAAPAAAPAQSPQSPKAPN